MNFRQTLDDTPFLLTRVPGFRTMAGNGVLRATLANHLLEVENSITPMRASVPRIEAQFVVVGPRLCGDRASSNDERVERGMELHQTPAVHILPCKSYTEMS